MRLFANLIALIAAITLAAQPVAAQSILRDAETEQFLLDIANPLVEAAGLQAGNVDIVLINDPSINAFVAGGQAIYIHSGLIEAADSANEVQGVIAHELGHITGGHIIRAGEGYQQATSITLLSMLAGIGAALAGAGDAAMGIMMAGQTAALSRLLSFTRTQEASADAAGAQYLSAAGISGKGSLAFFGKLLNLEFRHGVSQDDETGFWRTHPLSGDRIASLKQVYEVDPAWNTPSNPEIEKRFARIKAKLKGYVARPEDTLRDFPESDTSTPALVARAYAYHKDARMDRALAEVDNLLEREPRDPFFLELKGQVLLEFGQAAGGARSAASGDRAQPCPTIDRRPVRPCVDRDRG